MFGCCKKTSKVQHSFADNPQNAHVTNHTNAPVTNHTNAPVTHTTDTAVTNAPDDAYYSPQTVYHRPGNVVFDRDAQIYNPPVYNKFIPPVQDPKDLSGGYRGYRPEYPPPYSATVTYGGAYSRLIQ
ncbi:hypothetical protein V1264_019808 [Littorina saxatilis]|uniref:Uncharacterized protein n=1 Tax=Littorina saxatilis TaxID=31220 RepID=A0AAN9B8U6_9CAEN